jgi:hypothetical protein
MDERTRYKLFAIIRQWRIVTIVFIETSTFSRIREQYLDDDQLRLLQAALMRKPDAGTVIRKSGGLRKLRWSAGGIGKRGGLRVIYYWQRSRNRIFLMTAYRKNEMTDLTNPELRVLKTLVAEIELSTKDPQGG